MTVTSAPVTSPSGTFQVRVVRPEVTDTESPRTYDGNIGVLVANHRGYSLPFEGELAAQIHHALEYGLADRAFRVVERWLKIAHGARVVLPVYADYNPDLILRVGEVGEEATARNLTGIIYDTPQSRAGLPDATDERIAKTLTDEVTLYEQWRSNEVYEAIIEKLTGDDPANPAAWEQVDVVRTYYTAEAAMKDGLAALTTDHLPGQPHE